MTARIHHFSEDVTSRLNTPAKRILTWCVFPLAIVWFFVLAPVAIISLALSYCAYVIISVALTGKFWRICLRPESADPDGV